MLTISMLFEELDQRKRRDKWRSIIGGGLIGAGTGMLGYWAYKDYQDQHRWDPIIKGQLDHAIEVINQIGDPSYISPEAKAKVQELLNSGKS